MITDTETTPQKRADFKVRMERDLHARVAAAAEERGVTVNWFLNKIIEEAMDKLTPAQNFKVLSEGKIDANAGPGFVGDTL